MAINLQASFAACLAGLKVPPQIMYCIAQETGQPYVFYKDGMERGQGQGGQWGQGPPSQDLGGYLSSQQQSQQQLPPQSQQQQQPPTPQPASVSPRQLCDDGPVQSALTSPVASPYPQSVPDVPPTPMTPMTPMTPHPVGVADDDQVSGPLTPQHPPPSQSAAPQQGPSGPSSHEQQELSPPHNPGQHNPDIERCYNPSATPGLDLQQQQQQQQHHQYLSHHYSQRGHPVGPPPHVMSPTSFMHYLKQPGVLLTPLGPMGTEAVMAENFNSTMQDMRGMPDILQQQQQQQHQGKQGKHANSELRLFKCLTCGKDFKQKSTLLQHERIHTDSRPYGCTECGKRFRQQSHLTQHLRIHANEKPFACVYCERTFRQRAILNQHLRIHSGEKPFQCPECGKRFRQKAILNQHVRTHQDVSPHLVYKNGTLWPQDVPFPPDMDTKEPPTENGGSPFDSEHNAQTPDHQRQANGCFSPESNVQYPAYFKDAKGMNHAVFGSGSNFALQYLKQGKGLPDVIQHGRSAGMPLYVRCPICQKEFKQKSTLLQHGCIHIESRPYPCPECGKRFRQQSHLTQHVRIHTNEKPYGCGYCGRNFRQRTILNQHLRIHTGEKPYKCGQCGKDFRQKAILDQHTRTHQGERPFCCPMPNCRRRFATDPEVKKHMDNHMNPHANKGRRPNNNTDTKHLLGRGVPPTAVVKPELYFPQCYVPAFGHPNNAFVNNGGQPQNGDFKPIPTHPFAQNPSQSQTEHNGDFKNVQTGAAPVTIVPAHQFPPSNSGNPVQAHTNGEFPKPTPVQ